MVGEWADAIPAHLVDPGKLEQFLEWVCSLAVPHSIRIHILFCWGDLVGVKISSGMIDRVTGGAHKEFIG